MTQFLSEDFLLKTKVARTLYHEFASSIPIYDFHTHLPVEDIAQNRSFDNITQLWLSWDHYKWRAMRAAGVEERFITGDAPDRERFLAWAQTVPKTMGNPLFVWTHLELKRYFGISGVVLGPGSAEKIYDRCNEMLRDHFFMAKGLIRRMNVRVLFTTDDPTSTLEHHLALGKDQGYPVVVVPCFRPDRALSIDDPPSFLRWLRKLEEVSLVEIRSFETLTEALARRHQEFHLAGCRCSDMALDRPYAEKYFSEDIEATFKKVLGGIAPNSQETARFRTAMVVELCKMNSKRGWVQQFHIGALRNISSRGWSILGPDSGFDAIGDQPMAKDLAAFMDLLEREGALGKTILYPMNPKDMEVMVTIGGCFQDGTHPGKIQLGPAWWFNDQKYGIEAHLKVLSAMGMLSSFVGMVTDSRSFLSFPRHEYFRRILCDFLGQQVEEGELPWDMELLGGMVRDICYSNALRYFGVKPKGE